MKNSNQAIYERRKKILAVLEEKTTVSVSELAEQFEVSPLTMRRDLHTFERQKLISRRYGSVTLLDPASNEFSSKFILHKRAIAKLAAQQVRNGDTIFLNTSSTALLMIDYIRAKNVTIITNNASAMNLEPNPDIILMLIGGELRAPKGSLVGDLAVSSLKQIKTKKCFLGCTGISMEHGITTALMQEATINELMLRQAEERTILADFSKFGVSHSFRYGSIGNIHRLITDTKAPADEINAMKAAGLQILQARV